jgi:molybdopterin converting factor small subunit
MIEVLVLLVLVGTVAGCVVGVMALAAARRGDPRGLEDALRRGLGELRQEFDQKAATQRLELNQALSRLTDVVDQRIGALTSNLDTRLGAFAELQQKIGSDLADGQHKRLTETNQAVGKLTETLQTEREAVDAWYEESQAILADRRALEIMGEEGHREALLRVEEEYQRRLGELRGYAAGEHLGMMANYFGELNSLAGGNYEELARLQKTFAAGQALVNAYLAASQALADPSVPFILKAFAVGKVLASGLGLYNAIKGGGSVGGGGGGGGVASRAATPAPAQRDRSLRIEVLGDGMFADQLRANIETIADAMFDEGRRGGTRVVVG